MDHRLSAHYAEYMKASHIKISAADLTLDPEDLEAELEEQEFAAAARQFRWKKKHVAKVNNTQPKVQHETHV